MLVFRKIFLVVCLSFFLILSLGVFPLLNTQAFSQDSQIAFMGNRGQALKLDKPDPFVTFQGLTPIYVFMKSIELESCIPLYCN